MATTTTSSSAPWVAQQPFLTRGFQRAENSFNNDARQFYPGQTFTNAAPETTQSINQLRGLANSGSQVAQGGQQLFNDTINGNYLNANPHLDQTFNQASDAVKRNYQNIIQPKTDGQFSQGGRFGSRWHDKSNATNQFEMGNALNNLATNIYGGNYAQERQNQQSMFGQAPIAQGLETLDASRLGQVGQYQEGRENLQLQDDMNRFNFGQQETQDNLDRYLGRITGGGSGSSSTTRSSGGDSGGGGLQGALGGGLLGYGAGKALDWLSPTAGAIGGGLLGAFL